MGCFIPFQVILLPMARTLGALGLSQSLTGLICVHVIYGLAFTTLFFRNFYVTIPDELVQAAKIDGAGFFRIFWRIMLPLAKPAIAVTALFSFMTAWNEFILAATFMSDERSFTLPVVLQSYVGDFGTPEQQIPATGLPGMDWETCMTMNNHWGYNKHDDHWKSTEDLLRRRKIVQLMARMGFGIPGGSNTTGKDALNAIAVVCDRMDRKRASHRGCRVPPRPSRAVARTRAAWGVLRGRYAPPTTTRAVRRVGSSRPRIPIRRAFASTS